MPALARADARCHLTCQGAPVTAATGGGLQAGPQCLRSAHPCRLRRSSHESPHHDSPRHAQAVTALPSQRRLDRRDTHSVSGFMVGGG
jgi:3-oxoacyl-ACP reductase-like protein